MQHACQCQIPYGEDQEDAHKNLIFLSLLSIHARGLPVQSGIVPIKVGVPVVGDVTVAVWFGAYNLGQRLHSRPALAFAFHTAFADQGSVRITVDQLDLADAALVPPDAAKGFFIDVILTEAAQVCQRTLIRAGVAMQHR